MKTRSMLSNLGMDFRMICRPSKIFAFVLILIKKCSFLCIGSGKKVLLNVPFSFDIFQVELQWQLIFMPFCLRLWGFFLKFKAFFFEKSYALLYLLTDCSNEIESKFLVMFSCVFESFFFFFSIMI